jgi:hypothetical protein
MVGALKLLRLAVMVFAACGYGNMASAQPSNLSPI